MVATHAIPVERLCESWGLILNAERLHAVARVLQMELREARLPENLNELLGLFQNFSSQPQNTNLQQQIATKRDAISKMLALAPSNDFSPAWRAILDEIGALPVLGIQLDRRIQEIFNRNQMTPAVATQELTPIVQEVTTFKNTIDQLVDNLLRLKVGAEVLPPGEAEAGVAIPREAVRNDLGEFAKELRQFRFILRTFIELSTGSVDELPIRTISSSALMFSIDMVPKAAAFLAVAIERLVAVYKQILEIRKIRADLTRIPVPPENLKGLEDHAKNLMKENIETITLKMVADSPVADPNRKNELANQLRISLTMIANRIDRNYNIEVRMAAPKKPGESPEADEALETIQHATPSMQYMRLEGDPILQLPEPEKKDSED